MSHRARLQEDLRVLNERARSISRFEASGNLILGHPDSTLYILYQTMRLFQVIYVIFALFTTSALAVDNCKCQDSYGQYNDLTEACCDEQTWSSYALYPGPNHQCTDDTLYKSIDGTEFDQCCKDRGVGGAFCWNWDNRREVLIAGMPKPASHKHQCTAIFMCP